MIILPDHASPVVPVHGRSRLLEPDTLIWWRRIKVSAVFHISSRRDSRNPAATRVVTKNTSRRHMIGDHHGRTAGRATLLARAADEILGTQSTVSGRWPA